MSTKARKHTFVVTASFSRELDPKRAQYFLNLALSKIHDLGKDHGRNPPMPVKMIRASVKNLGRVAGSLKVKDRKRKLDMLERLKVELGDHEKVQAIR